MLSVQYDTKDFSKKMKNMLAYSNGFLSGAKMNQTTFNKILSEYTVEALYKFIDSKARMNPQYLHHVYEWERVGDSNARLFKFDTKVNSKTISISGKFLPSSSIGSSSNTPFVDKANVMENSIEVIIEPKNSDVLVFENEGETVFTRNSIYIEHPGGDLVAGSFGKVVDDFFEQYFINAFLNPLVRDLENADEFIDYFSQGVTRGGRTTGILAGKKYMTPDGVVIE